jgi:ferric-dicitrate binding protein FerR (iron transport regulator)
MKEMKKREKLTEKEWVELASLLSGEQDEKSEVLSRFLEGDALGTEKHWKELKKMDDDKEINVDRAWDRLWSRMDENGLIEPARARRYIFAGIPAVRIAATILILLTLGSGLIYLNNKGLLSSKTTIATTSEQQNIRVDLPDGSVIFLNRSTELSYNRNFSRHGRNVALKGEALFNIAHDEANPFTVSAGSAKIRVLGTTFNIIADNTSPEVEVFVQTGKVMLSDNSGEQSLVIDPGYIGTIGSGQPEVKLNSDLNYLAWNTGKLIYSGQKLENVFNDLRKIYRIEINTNDIDILSQSITSTFENQSHETIILVICTTFNLSFTRDGNVYHLSRR